MVGPRFQLWPDHASSMCVDIIKYQIRTGNSSSTATTHNSNNKVEFFFSFLLRLAGSWQLLVFCISSSDSLQLPDSPVASGHVNENGWSVGVKFHTLIASHRTWPSISFGMDVARYLRVSLAVQKVASWYWWWKFLCLWPFAFTALFDFTLGFSYISLSHLPHC